MQTKEGSPRIHLQEIKRRQYLLTTALKREKAADNVNCAKDMYTCISKAQNTNEY